MSIDASFCLFHRVQLPDRYPVQPRPEMAARPPLVVAMRGTQTLLCGCEHTGPHLWPNGDEVFEEEPAPVDAPWVEPS